MDKYRNATDPKQKRQAKVFAVVSFLAILELVKKGIGNVLQSENFADIELVQPHPASFGSDPLLQGEGTEPEQII
jgi:chromatin segregation and condensation protein Rec8/ScpA/Scc1 (kleisin family)